LKEIIEHISKIDAVAYKNEQKINAILAKERNRLEDEVKTYREQVLSNAEKEAKALYTRIKNKTNDEYLQKEDKIKKFTYKLKTNYQAVEDKIVRDVIDKLIERE
jgi:phenylalanyl-tRNA synthetase alpha subunit